MAVDLNDFNRLETSLTIGCIQCGLGAKYYFPCCPKEIGMNPMETYFQNFKVGAVFAYNDDSPKLMLLRFVRIMNNSSILVMCEREGIMCEREGFKPWSITEIKFENGFFVHFIQGSFFEKDEADKEFSIQNSSNFIFEKKHGIKNSY